VGIIVVRYFGGSLLGVPGLINAYKTAASLVLQTIPIVQKPILVAYSLQFDYNSTNQVMQILKHTNCIVNTQEINLFSNLQIHVPKSSEEELLFKIKNLPNIGIQKII